jgi:DNA-binding response OmpR family regulator
LAKSVLIVDDEKLLLRTLSSALKDVGYRISTAGSAEQAEKQFAQDTPIDLVLVDNRLPKASGLELVRRLRERSVRCRVILMTAYETPEVKAEAKKLKVDRYIKKPFDLTALLAEIETLIGPGGNGSGSSAHTIQPEGR